MLNHASEGARVDPRPRTSGVYGSWWKGKSQKLRSSEGQKTGRHIGKPRRRCEALPGEGGASGHRRSKAMKESARYLKIVEWSDKDQCFVGSCPGLFYGGC